MSAKPPFEPDPSVAEAAVKGLITENNKVDLFGFIELTTIQFVAACACISFAVVGCAIAGAIAAYAPSNQPPVHWEQRDDHEVNCEIVSAPVVVEGSGEVVIRVKTETPNEFTALPFGKDVKFTWND